MDTNVLVYAHAGRSEQCRRLLHRLQRAAVTLIGPAVVWAELCHIYMLEEVRRSSVTEAPLQAVRRNPERVKQLRFYRERLSAWKDLGLAYEPVTREDFLDAGLKFQAKYGLLTHDSLVLAAAVRLGVDCLITNDRGFFATQELEIVRPSDVRGGAQW